jgi:hypothetical protein
MNIVNINLSINNDNDLGQLVSLYSGIVAGVSMQNSTTGVLNQLAANLEAELMKIYSPEQWQAVKAQVTENAQKAANVASKNTFDDLTID